MNINTNIEYYQVKKKNNLMIADAFAFLGQKKKAMRLRECGTALVFALHQSGATSLAHANFCRERLCPMCQWRRSLRLGAVLTNKIASMKEKGTAIFLTLTVKNVLGKNLKETLNAMFSGWSRLIRRKDWKKYVKHSIRTCEVTYNKKRKTYHPHFHCLLFVDDEYFKNGKPYWTNQEIQEVWQECCKLEYKPVVDIRKVKNEITHTVNEVAKYCVKATDVICDDKKETALVVNTLAKALKGRRLINGTGELRFNIDKEMKMINKDDLISDPILKLLFFKWNYNKYKMINLDKIKI